MARAFTPTAAALLLLSSGLFNFAWGLFSSHGDDVSSDFKFEMVRGQFELIRAQILRQKDLRSASATTTTTGLHSGDTTYPGVPGARDMPSSEMLTRLVIASRNLQQSACADGTPPIFVSSTVFPLMEGCFCASDVNGTAVYATDTAVITPAESLNTRDPPIWLASYKASSEDYTSACVSAESADDVDPPDATWFCDIDNDGARETTGDVLSVSCGCPIASPSRMLAESPEPTTAPPTCGEGGHFSIASETLPGAEGCYLNTTTVINDHPVYTTSGTGDEGQIWMVAFELKGDYTSTGPAIAWALANVSFNDESEESDLYCLSVVQAALYHPSEVPEWTCDEGKNISVECGCSSSPSSSARSPVPSPTARRELSPLIPPTPVSSPTSPTAQPIRSYTRGPPTLVSPPPSAVQPAASSISPRTTPVVPPTAQATTEPTSTSAPSSDSVDGPLLSSDTCGGDGSFTIAANASPNLNGCYVQAEASKKLSSFAYTSSGTTNALEVIVFSVVTDDGDFNWAIGENLTNDEIRLYCVSDEPASEVNPGMASWSCDFTGDGDNFLAMTEEDISIVCGSCSTVEQDHADSSSAS